MHTARITRWLPGRLHETLTQTFQEPTTLQENVMERLDLKNYKHIQVSY